MGYPAAILMDRQQIVETILLGLTVWWALDALKFVIEKKLSWWTDFTFSFANKKTQRLYKLGMRSVLFFSIVSLLAAIYVTFIDKTYTLFILQIGLVNAILCPLVDIKVTAKEEAFIDICGEADQTGRFEELLKQREENNKKK